MACGDFNTGREFLANGQFFDAVYCHFSGQMGELLFGLMVFGTLAFAMYIYSDTVIVPFVVTLILAGVVLALLPAVVSQVAIVAIILVGVGSVIVLLLRMSRAGG